MLANNPLHRLTANDLMSRDVVMIPQQMSLRAAAHLLAQAQISGAPVVDEAGCCLGVLSSTDFLRRAGNEEHTIIRPCLPGPYVSEWQVIDMEALPTDAVS